MKNKEKIDINQAKSALEAYGQSKLLSLTEAARKLSVSEKYLLGLIKQGRLKAFKIDDHWLLDHGWAEEWRQKLEQSVSRQVAESKENISQHLRLPTWVKYIHEDEPEAGMKFFSFANLPVMLALLLAASTLFFYFSISLVPLAKLSILAFNSSGLEITDEAITAKGNAWISLLSGHGSGKVAGEAEGIIK